MSVHVTIHRKYLQRIFGLCPTTPRSAAEGLTSSDKRSEIVQIENSTVIFHYPRAHTSSSPSSVSLAYLSVYATVLKSLFSAMDWTPAHADSPISPYFELPHSASLSRTSPETFANVQIEVAATSLVWSSLACRSPVWNSLPWS